MTTYQGDKKSFRMTDKDVCSITKSKRSKELLFQNEILASTLR